MFSSLHNLIRRQRERIASNAAASLLKEPSADVTARVKQMEAVDKILDGLPVPASQRFLIPLGTAIICALIIWLTWVVRVDHFNIKTWVAIEVNADQADLELNAAWELNQPLPLASDGLTINHASFEFVNRGLFFDELPSGSRVDVVSTPPSQRIALDLDQLHIEKGSALQFEPLGNDRIRISLRGPGEGEILIGGDTEVSWQTPDVARTTERKSFDRAETLLFENGPETFDIATLEFSKPEMERFVFRHFNVSSVKFGRDVQLLPGKRTIVSTIRNGTLRLTELDQTFQLDPGVGIQLAGLDGQVRELSVDPDGNTIAIDYQGYVDSVILLSPGSGGKLETGLRRDLTPNLLTYAYHNRSFGLVVAAASFIWGALIYLRRLVS